MLFTGITTVVKYFKDNWEDIKEQWVQVYQQKSGNLLNETNNRLESFNQKLKAVITKYTGLVDCFIHLKIWLKSRRDEQDRRAVNSIIKSPVT